MKKKSKSAFGEQTKNLPLKHKGAHYIEKVMYNDEEAFEKIVDYMTKENRPYSV